ncbi:aromatic amino acid aminotransferase I [Fusarium albosuccineum]|uniref:aromatic-amino-acid transaminase n=1 Tax=Fusarium albosuccineum TaxID=1237068 RepID=A0A8H4PH18_9HYPO|nr:aromatic amino acid aminotransferase I [Fusarium albosuccineum]
MPSRTDMDQLMAYHLDSDCFDKIRKRRKAAGGLKAGVAAVSDSDMFKAPSTGKPLAKNWNCWYNLALPRGCIFWLTKTAHFSRETLSRLPCAIKQASGYLKQPGIISLGGGLPSSEYFPYAEISMRVPKPPHFSEQHVLSEEAELAQTITIGKYDVQKGLSEYDLSIALNYGQAMGSAQMMRFITEHTELIYNPPYADWGVCQTVGSTAALEQTIRMLCDKDRGDAVLTEEYTFSTALSTIVPLGIKVVGVKIDEQGLLPDEMDRILASWDDSNGVRKPHVLYTVPSGQNPTGATQGIERRHAIYKVCQKHDIFIIEDEPYYFLQMPPYSGKAELAEEKPETVQDFVSGLVPSFISLDIDGRVLRMDSFSKVLIPGSRMGWVTASKQVIQQFIRLAEVANQGPSGLAQIMLWKLLDETWGHEGYLEWLMSLKRNYTRRRNMLLSACDEFLPKDLVSWTPPSAGMFLWLKVDHTKHPEFPQRSIPEIEQDVFSNALENGVLCARGSWFRAEPHTAPSELFFRTTFAAATEDAMRTAIQRLSTAIRQAFRHK